MYAKMVEFVRRVLGSEIANEKTSLDTDSFSNPEKKKPVNYRGINVTPKIFETDVNYAVQVANSYLGLLSDPVVELNGKTVLELGPGINTGSALILACNGARVMVADRFLAPWQNDYHSHFYNLLKDWIQDHRSDWDTKPIDRVVNQSDYIGVIERYECSTEDLCPISSNTVDIIFSNAVLEHVYDPEKACSELARITKKDGKGFHQVDFRDHRDFDRPLEFLLMADEEFNKLFKDVNGECGNRLRPFEFASIFESTGFEVLKYASNMEVDDKYMEAFLERMNKADNSKYAETRVEKLNSISGRFFVKKTA